MKKLLSTLMLAAVVAAPAGAQTLQWNETCTSVAGPDFGTPICMSAKLTYNAGTGGVNLWVWNLQGLAGTYNAEGLIDAVGLGGVPWSAASINTFSASYGGASRTSEWQTSTSGIPGAGCCTLTFGIKKDGGNGTPIGSGLDATPSAGVDYTSWTNAATNFPAGTGAVLFSFFVTPGLTLDANSVWLFAHVRDAGLIDGQVTSDQFYCLSDGATTAKDFCGGRDNPDDPGEIVPEPATMTLLATGLAAMGVAQRRRRKDRNTPSVS